MAVRSIKKIPIYVWIPPTNATFSIQVVTSSGTIYDITEEIIEGEYTDGITETIGNFRFKVDNSNQQYTNIWNLYDSIKIYMDYNYTTASTLRFFGKIEKISKQQEYIVISGRSLSSRVFGISVTKSYTDTYTHEILLDLIQTYCPYITTNNIDTNESTDTTMTVNWFHRPFWECVLELCNKSGYDAYIDPNGDFNYFVSGSRLNTVEAVLHDSNLIEVGDFTPDLTVVKNRIRVYGGKVDDIQIIWTEEDLTSISNYDLREEIINDSSILTIEQAQARAQYELSLKKDPPIVGEVTSLGIVTIMPGEKIRISDPLSDLQPNYYVISKYTHKFSNDEPMKTVLTVVKEQTTLPKILKKRIKFETESMQNENPNEMKYTWFFDFNTDVGSHSNTAISGGRLYPTSSSGTWISNTLQLTSYATSFELRASGSILSSIKFYISSNNGIDWTEVNLNTRYGSDTSPQINAGLNIKLKVVFNSQNCELNTLALYYK